MFKNKNSHSFYCPVCGQKKRMRAKDLVCPDCYETYVREAGRALVQGSVLFLTQWVLPKAENLLKEFQEQLLQKQAAFKVLQKQVSDGAFEEIRKNAGGKFIPKEIFSAALGLQRKELWKAKSGNRLFAEMKVLEEQVSFLQGVIKEIREKNNHFSPKSDCSSVPEVQPEVQRADDSVKSK